MYKAVTLMAMLFRCCQLFRGILKIQLMWIANLVCGVVTLHLEHVDYIE